ncbi:MAG: response regulator transcription factor [bacterium]|nr:response regulator transcription factor [bacterium]
MLEKQDIILRYVRDGESIREITRETGISRRTVSKYVSEYLSHKEALVQSPNASHSNARTCAEYPHRERACSEVADVPVVLRGGERLLHGKGGHGRTQLAQETSAGHEGSENRSQPHCGE